VPVNPARFDRRFSMGAGMAITASAGPISNMILAVLSAVALGLVARFAPGLTTRNGAVVPVLVSLLYMNVGLALFNLIPLPPLDGSRVVAWLMPYRLQQQWHALEQYAPFLLLAVFWFGGRLVSGPIYYLGDLMLDLARLIS
jgi:Zn-dependent protease